VCDHIPVTADLIDLARAGDGDAFRQLVGPYERELQVHCYRMLGSVADAEDALQDALLAAWQGLGAETVCPGRFRPSIEHHKPDAEASNNTNAATMPHEPDGLTRAAEVRAPLPMGAGNLAERSGEH